MEVGAIQSINGISSNAVANGDITEETFLQLLSTQLQHQDPLEPASDVEFIQQMATFASLEQQRITNSNLQVMGIYESSINNSNALNLVGKEVKVQDSALEHQAGQSHSFLYEGADEAARVKISVLDADGNEVYTQTQVGSTDGEQEFIWYGNDTSGEPVEDGDYTVEIELEDGDGNSFDTPIFQNQKVKGISYENGRIMLLIGDKRIPIENVVEVYGAGLNGSDDPPEDEPDTPFKNKQLDANLLKMPFIGQTNPNPYHPFRVIAGGK